MTSSPLPRTTRLFLYILVLVSCTGRHQTSASSNRPQFSPNRAPSTRLYPHDRDHHARHSLEILEEHPLELYHGKTPGFLNGVVLVSATNLLINVLRPDEAIMWQFKVPRILWEICLMFTATICKVPASTPSNTSSLVYLTLSTMLWTTALTDIFLWAPLFAFWSGMDNEDCSGGWFTGRPYVCVKNPEKGYGRLLVTM
ncbi:expressed unknown protein [Seminavis robusta]|uniref:Uncharacterized protein n=1 Tax=Seminavis robusta TaxID=568900 RepID=A0A9N8H7D0_9STRA|nr:expressed unknown protein [Seminavis robusta]|eukprot:Sro175_g076950.1 n/a (199) ;mRNA; f:23986-24768